MCSSLIFPVRSFPFPSVPFLACFAFAFVQPMSDYSRIPWIFFSFFFHRQYAFSLCASSPPRYCIHSKPSQATFPRSNVQRSGSVSLYAFIFFFSLSLRYAPHSCSCIYLSAPPAPRPAPLGYYALACLSSTLRRALAIPYIHTYHTRRSF